MIFIEGKADYIYIGAVDRLHDGRFVWIISGEAAARPTRPLYNSYCGKLDYRQGTIHPVPCTNPNYVLCEAPLK